MTQPGFDRLGGSLRLLTEDELQGKGRAAALQRRVWSWSGVRGGEAQAGERDVRVNRGPQANAGRTDSLMRLHSWLQGPLGMPREPREGPGESMT